MLSLTCKIGIKAVIYLASRYEAGDRAGIVEVADAVDASAHTVGKVLQKLVKHAVINSAKGPAGGFYISGKQLNQPIINIVAAIDGLEVFRQCGLGLSKCSSRHPCPMYNEYKEARDLMEKMFSRNSVLDLCGQVNDGLAHLVG